MNEEKVVDVGDDGEMWLVRYGQHYDEMNSRDALLSVLQHLNDTLLPDSHMSQFGEVVFFVLNECTFTPGRWKFVPDTSGDERLVKWTSDHQERSEFPYGILVAPKGTDTTQ